MKKVLVLAAILAIAAPLWAAEIVDSGKINYAGTMSLGGTSSRYIMAYENNATATGGYSRPNPPAEEIGDDLLLTQGGTLDHLGFTVYNSSSSAGVLSSCDLTLKFYNYDGVSSYALAGTLAYDNVTFSSPLAVGYYTWLTVDNLAQLATPITLSSDILATLTISDLQGGSNRVGQIVHNPPTIGSSEDVFFRGGSWYYFTNHNPLANFGWEIGVIPEPASLLLVLVGSALIRRR